MQGKVCESNMFIVQVSGQLVNQYVLPIFNIFSCSWKFLYVKLDHGPYSNYQAQINPVFWRLKPSLKNLFRVLGPKPGPCTSLDCRIIMVIKIRVRGLIMVLYIFSILVIIKVLYIRLIKWVEDSSYKYWINIWKKWIMIRMR